MLKLYIRDNTDGSVHEYGTNQHDALVLQKDGSLHYENLQCCCGTEFPEEGDSFCLADGHIPNDINDIDDENYIDIGGEYYSKGEWEDKHHTINTGHCTISGTYPTCNLCGYAEVGMSKRTNFCPNCGAKMKGVKQ